MRTDLELLAAWRKGDQAAGNALFDRHFDPLTRFFRRRAGERADDLVQETLLACVRGRDRFAGNAAFRTYMFATARRVLQRARQDWFLHEERVVADADALYAQEPSPDRQADLARERARLQAAIAALPEGDRRTLELYFDRDLTGAEVGDALGIPEPTARSRIRLALNRLRRAIDDG